MSYTIHRPTTATLLTTKARYCAKINDPILGPPGVRLLLLCRGFSGQVFGLTHSLVFQ